MDLALELLEHWILVLMFAVLILSMAGIPNTGLGVHNMFHDDKALIDVWVKGDKSRGIAPNPLLPYLNSPAIFVQCYVTVFAVLGWGFIYTLQFVDPEVVKGWEALATPPDVMQHMLGEIVWHVLATAAISLFFGVVPVSEAVRPLQPGEPGRCVIGVALGLAIGWAIVVLAIRVEPILQNRFGAPAHLSPTMAMAVPAFFVLMGLLFYRKLISGITVVTLFSMILLFYALMNLAPEGYHPLILLGLVGAIVFFSNLYAKLLGMKEAPLKFRIPGLVDATGESLYDDPVLLSDKYPSSDEPVMEVMFRRAKSAAKKSLEPANTSQEPLPEPENGKIDPVAALENWAQLERNRPENNGGQKPKLVLVATSGGAYRASFWTALVLDSLAAFDKPKGALSGFSQSIRLITGASGGMVGGAYFTAMMNPDGTPPASLLPKMSDDILDAQWSSKTQPKEYAYKRRFPLPRDSLSAVAQQLVQHDIPRLFMTGVQAEDRGRVLEDQWLTLNTSFEDLRADEAAGRKPSIVFSPMLVETGQPLLITNLDMGRVNGDLLDESVEFFDWFPHSRPTFKLKTAVRLNAAFPYIAPAAALPTKPYRRPVDAGYYDNYGVDLATSYLSQPRIQKWIVENTSGVMVIQIRAFPFTLPGAKDPKAISRGLQWLTTPIEGAGSARGATMKFRNNQSLRRTENLYKMETGDPHFLRSAIFEVDSKTSLSWYMPEKELMELVGGAMAKVNRFALEGIVAFWQNLPPPVDIGEVDKRMKAKASKDPVS
ncbi:MAG: hypothetical protein AAFR17_16755 [Pseudomonadota bacterium]